MARKRNYTDLLHGRLLEEGHQPVPLPATQEQFDLQRRLSQTYNELEKARMEAGRGIANIAQCGADHEHVDEVHKKLGRLMRRYIRDYGAGQLPKAFRELPDIQAIIEDQQNVEQRVSSPVLGGKPVLGF